jgi:hypothetical protein
VVAVSPLDKGHQAIEKLREAAEDYRGDPLQHPMEGLVAFLEVVEEATRQVGKPLTREQIEQIAHDLVREAKWAAVQSLSQENRRYLLDIALGAFAGVALCVALTIGAYFYGRSETQSEIAEIPSLLLNSHQAETWAKITRNNNIQAVMDECKPQLDSSGRYACWVGLWTDPPRQPQAKQ